MKTYNHLSDSKRNNIELFRERNFNPLYQMRSFR